MLIAALPVCVVVPTVPVAGAAVMLAVAPIVCVVAPTAPLAADDEIETVAFPTGETVPTPPVPASAEIVITAPAIADTNPTFAEPCTPVMLTVAFVPPPPGVARSRLKVYSSVASAFGFDTRTICVCMMPPICQWIANGLNVSS